MAHAGSNPTEAPRVGVALCTYNGARYLPAQLEGLLTQTVPIDEVVIGDDGSTDATLAILADFARRAEAMGIRVEVIQRTRNLGYVLNFSDTLQRCRADIIFMCDQDDVWYPERVETFVSAFNANPALLMLHSDARLVDGNGEPIGAHLLATLRVHPAEVLLESAGRVFDAMLVRNFITGATCALRRSLLTAGLPVAPRWSHDEWLAVVASLQGGLAMLPMATIDYRQHGGNQIGAGKRSLIDRLRRLDLFNPAGRQRTAERLQALDGLLRAHGVPVAPASLPWLQALAWRMAWSRLQLYRRPDVSAAWVLADAPRLLARVINTGLAGAGWKGLGAACAGAWRGWHGRDMT